MPFPKVGKRIQTRKSANQAKDRAESAFVMARSGGRCEVLFADGNTAVEQVLFFANTGEHPRGRCIRRAVHVHHKLSGRGVRGIGASALAENKLHVCPQCHDDIHAKRLIPVGDKFKRRKAA